MPATPEARAATISLAAAAALLGAAFRRKRKRAAAAAARAAIRLQARYYRQSHPSLPVGYVEEEVCLGGGDTAFLIIDVYGLGFDDDDDAGSVASFYSENVRRNRRIVRDHIRPAKDAAKKLGLPIIYLTNHLFPTTNEHTEWRNMSIRTVGVDVLEAWAEPNDVLKHSEIIAPQPGDHLVRKQMYSGFFETGLEPLLKELKVRNLVTVGFDSRICLCTTVTDAMYRDYRIVVLRDSCGTSEYPETEGGPDGGWASWMAIRFIENNVGYTSTSKAFVAACAAAEEEEASCERA